MGKFTKKLKKGLKKAAPLLIAGLAAKALMARRKKASMASMDDAGIGVTHPALTGGNAVTEKVVPDVAAKTGSYLGKMQGGNPNDPTGHEGQITRANAAKRARRNAAMNYQRSQTFDAKAPTPHAYDRDYSNYTGWAYKKGGRVTGIAKRGFGRALMKGKK